MQINALTYLVARSASGSARFVICYHIAFCLSTVTTHKLLSVMFSPI